MPFRLPSTITSLDPYNGHIPRIFLDVYIISLKYRECAKLRWVPLLQAALFASILLVALPKDFPSSADAASRYLQATSRRPWHPSLILCFDACAVSSSRVFGFRAEGQRRPASSLLVLGLGSSTRVVLSSRSFDDQTEGGVPNSSPSEPWSDLQEGWGFDLVGAFGAPKRHPSGWALHW